MIIRDDAMNLAHASRRNDCPSTGTNRNGNAKTASRNRLRSPCTALTLIAGAVAWAAGSTASAADLTPLVTPAKRVVDLVISRLPSGSLDVPRGPAASVLPAMPSGEPPVTSPTPPQAAQPSMPRTEHPPPVSVAASPISPAGTDAANGIQPHAPGTEPPNPETSGTTHIASLSGDMLALKDSTTVLATRLDTADKTLATLSTGVAANHEEIANLATNNAANISALHASLSTGVGALTNALHTLNASSNTRGKEVDIRLGKLTDELDATRSDVGSLSTSTASGMRALATDIGKLNAGAAALATRLDEADNHVATRVSTLSTSLSTGIGTLTDGMKATRGDVDSLSISTASGMRALATDIGKLNAGAAALATRLDESGRDLVALSTGTHRNLTSLSTGMSDIADQLSQLATSVGEQNERVARTSGLATDLNGTGADRPAVTPGSNSAAIGARSRDEGRADVVSIGSASRQRQLVNVAPGTQATDAVNLGQLGEVRSTLSTALAQQQRQIGSLGTQLQQTDRMARQGIAAVGAMASIPELDRDANFGVGLGTATFLGQKAMALALRARVSDNLKLSINGGVAGAQRVLGTGVMYQWK